MMDRDALLVDMRDKLGTPSVDDISNRSLAPFLRSAARWMASELDLPVKTSDRFLGLADDVYRYALPPDVAEILWVYSGTLFLNPMTTTSWVNDGIDYTSSTSGTPREFAIDGRELLLYPAPESDFVDDYPWLKAQYIVLPQDTADGYSFLPAGAEDALTYQAAAEYLIAHAQGESMQAMLMKADVLSKQAGARIGKAKQRSFRTARGAEEMPRHFSRMGSYAR